MKDGLLNGILIFSILQSLLFALLLMKGGISEAAFYKRIFCHNCSENHLAQYYLYSILRRFF
jgi:hypothetical protein